MTDHIFGPLYQQGHVSVDYPSMIQAVGGDASNLLDCTFGVQVNHDGRVWVCINGVTWLRFKPNGKAVLHEQEEA